MNQSSQDRRPQHSLPGSTRRKEGRAISAWIARTPLIAHVGQVGVLGTGSLRDAIVADLEQRDGPDPTHWAQGDVGGMALILAVADSRDAASHVAARRLAQQHGVSWLPVRTELDVAIIGPAERAGRPGCAQCVDLRRGRTPADAAARAALIQHYGSLSTELGAAYLTPLAVFTVAALALDEAQQLVREGPTARKCDTIVRIELARLRATRHRFLPAPHCPVCGRLPGDTAELADLRSRFRPRPKPDVHTHRVRSLSLDELTDRYVDQETGLLRELKPDVDLPIAQVNVALPVSGNFIQWGIGRTDRYSSSRLVAILEALERHSGGAPQGKLSTVRGSFANLSAEALDPRTLGCHPQQSYLDPTFPYRPFSDADELPWCWGYSFARQAPILVPESLAYYDLPPERRGPRHLYEISNGCALGGCLEEAILHGLLEVAERDAFLLTWYSRTAAPSIDLSGSGDPQIMYAVEAMSVRGYDLYAFDVTMEHEVPCVWVQAVRSSEDRHKIKTMCAAGAHLTLRRAVRNALAELLSLTTFHMRRSPEVVRRAASMVADPFLVATMQDHSELYGADEAFNRFDFLFSGGQDRTTSPLDSTAFTHDDLTEDLYELVRRYLDRGRDVIVVDQTGPELQASGLSCVKVLVPGLIPMTFGHRNRRIDGLSRLREVPVLLGHRSGLLLDGQVNPHPHPFP